jgi:hypothetical protein
MQYMLLIYEERRRVIDSMTPHAHVRGLRRGDEEGGDLRLRRAAARHRRPPASAWSTARRTSWTVRAEAKEHPGGFHIIDVPDLDTAPVWAA